MFLKSLRKGLNIIPNQGHRNWKKGCFFEKTTINFRKGAFKVQLIVLIKTICSLVSEKGGGGKILIKNQRNGSIFYSFRRGCLPLTMRVDPPGQEYFEFMAVSKTENGLN